MAVYVNNITINTGEYFSRDFYLDDSNGPLDLTGYTAASQVRKHPESLNAAATFNVGFIDRANGRVRISLKSSDSVDIKPGRYVWDMMFTDTTGKKSIVIEGNVLATEDVTPSCVVTSYANEEIGFILEANGFGPHVTGTSITINDINDYGTVRLGFVSGCQTLANAVSLIRNTGYKNSLVQYLQSGGVIWVNNEWFTQNGCGDEAGMNEILIGLGSEIRQDNVDITTGPLFMDRSNDSSVVESNFPIELYSNASGTFTGGTPVYTVGAQVTVAYEKIGSGILYVSADTNTFDADTFEGKPTDFATVGQQLYSALRNLVLNS